MPFLGKGQDRQPRDSWYRELTIRFADGQEERFFIEFTQTGTHIPAPSATPAEWVKLEHEKCEGCPLPEGTRYCPAAESLEATLLRLADHYSHESVTAIAIDGANRQTLVNAPLQEVGSAMVHVAVFSSGCPVGREFRPLLNDLRPFSTNEELGRHLVTKFVLKHKGQLDESRQEIVAKLQPLREILSGLCQRLPQDGKGDAMANSIVSLDVAAMSIELEIDHALNDLAGEMGWEAPLEPGKESGDSGSANAPTSPPSPAGEEEPGLMGKLKKWFGNP